MKKNSDKKNSEDEEDDDFPEGPQKVLDAWGIKH